jgi:tRNA U34 5-methylaminomethyl-2-thiouridine-forming methyltransferase MnmC
MYRTRIIRTADGSDTLYVPEINEHYHSVYGAVLESEHIFVKNGFDFCKSNPVEIFEVGFGTGLNVFLTAIRNLNSGKEVRYTAIDKFPLPSSLTDSLNYKDFAIEECKEIMSKIHNCSWNSWQEVCNNFFLKKIKGDIITDSLNGSFDLVYFDAFGPDKQPEIWSENIFNRISDMVKENGILVTYTVKGEIKRRLKRNRFSVSLLPGPPGKRQMLRAVKFL